MQLIVLTLITFPLSYPFVCKTLHICNSSDLIFVEDYRKYYCMTSINKGKALASEWY